MDKPLGELTALDFLRVLNSGRASGLRTQIADKKKYELWVDESSIEQISVADLIDRVKNEKKKLELEFHLDQLQPLEVSLVELLRNENKKFLEDLIRKILLSQGRDWGDPAP